METDAFGNGSLSIQPCNKTNGGQLWSFDDYGSLRLAGNNSACLEAVPGGQENAVGIDACVEKEFSQKWVYDPSKVSKKLCPSISHIWPC